MKCELQPQRDSATARRYSEIAHHYSADWRGAFTPELQQQVDDFTTVVGKPPKKIMDAGCGTGKISTYLAELGYQVFCLDLSDGMLKEAINSARDRDVDIYPIQANMRSQCFADESLDAVWNMASLVHLDKSGKSEALSEFSRVLAPSGVLYISAQNLLHKKHLQRIWQSYHFWLGHDENNEYYQFDKTKKERQNDIGIMQRFKNGYAYLDDRHWFFPTKLELTSLLNQHGFEIISASSLFARRNDILAIKHKTNE